MVWCTAICCTISWFLVDSKATECIKNFDQLQLYHIFGLVGGIALCVAGAFNLATHLTEVIVVFYIFTTLIAGLGVMMFFAAYRAFYRPCQPHLDIIPATGLTDKNIFEAGDGKMIGVFILNICSAFMLLSAAGNFHRRT